MWPRTSRGARSVSAASYSPGGTQDQRKRPDRSPAPKDTARPCHASLPVQLKQEQDAFRTGDGAPARPPTSSPSRTRAGWPDAAAWSGVIAARKRTPQTATQEPSRRANSASACKTFSLPAPKSHIWMGAGRCWSTRASSHTKPLLRRQAASQNTADPIFSRSRPAQASAAPGISPPVLPASGAPFRVCRLNRSPCEGRRRKGTLCRRPPGAHDNRFERPRDEAPSPAGRSGAYRPNARARRGPLPRRGLPARDSTARSGPGRAESGRPRRRGPPREIARPRRT